MNEDNVTKTELSQAIAEAQKRHDKEMADMKTVQAASKKAQEKLEQKVADMLSRMDNNLS